MEPSDPEPSMEDILASIKQIIAEDGSAAGGRVKPRREPITFGDRPNRPGSPEVGEIAGEAPSDAQPEGGDGDGAAEALELDSPVTTAADQPSPGAIPVDPVAAVAEPIAPPDAKLVSDDAEAASRHALAALSARVVKPQTAADTSLEGLVREMLKPMLKDWLDARLPGVVERLVALEIARIAGGGEC